MTPNLFIALTMPSAMIFCIMLRQIKVERDRAYRLAMRMARAQGGLRL